MEWVYFFLAIICLTIGHLIKTLRLTQFIEPYEKPNDKVLLQALSLGYASNFFVPLRLGNIVRIWYAGIKMKNGKSFSLATIVVDIVLDFISVAIIFLFIYLFKNEGINGLFFHGITCIVLILLMIIALLFNKLIKFLIFKISSIFNNSIELKLLKTSWFTITSFKDILIRVKKSKLIITTILLWLFYLLSYYLLSLSITNFGQDIGFINIFESFYSLNGIFNTTFLWVLSFDSIYAKLMSIYVVLPILIVFLISLIYSFKRKTLKYRQILPQININDRLVFLEAYFNSDDRDYFKNYIRLNSDVAIIEDYSAGSNATTMLCSKENEIFYRKYSFGKDADKLNEQIKWIHEHEEKLTLTKIVNEYYKDNCCSYDMPYVPNTITCFNYVHSSPINKAWNVLEFALNDIHENLHSLNVRPSDMNTIDNYIEVKVEKNIKKIEDGKYIKPLLKYNFLYINGKKYHNLSYIKNYLTKEKLEKIFSIDNYSDIHGDFTIENIICFPSEKSKKNYYIIDPNPGNIHDAPALDYAKLLQSIHGGYEFLMNTKNLTVENDHIEFLFTKSNVYYQLFDKLNKYLETHFSKEQVKSIFYHEIIHWLRLMPYKIEKNGERCILFYAGLIMVANDVIEKYK